MRRRKRKKPAGVERSIPSAKVIDSLEWLAMVRGLPTHIRSDNGPEFVAQAVQNWLGEKGCQTLYIKPGSPWENPYVESFNGKLREECLNRHAFANGREAQEIVTNWREEYNKYRPHSSLGYQTPEEFASAFEKPRKLSDPGEVRVQILLLGVVHKMGIGLWDARISENQGCR